MKEIRETQANASKSQVSETIIEIHSSFSCYIHADVNRRRQINSKRFFNQRISLIEKPL